MKFSEEEVIQLIKAWALISVAFAISFYRSISFISPVQLFVYSSLTVGLSFLIHELAHKFLAQSYGCDAEFRSFDAGLILAIATAALGGFVFAAPGAVMIVGLTTREENGKISAIGPLTNIVLAVIFILLGFLFGPHPFFNLGSSINSWLAIFNLIPLAMLDGLKVLNWDFRIWSVLFLGALAVYFFAV